MTLLFKYKSFLVFETEITVQFANGKIVNVLQIEDAQGNIIKRADIWGLGCYSKAQAKTAINKFLSNQQQ